MSYEEHFGPRWAERNIEKENPYVLLVMLILLMKSYLIFQSLSIILGL
jgi:hypothetical protein